MNADCQLECPGCKIKSKVGFRMPALFRPTIFTFKCTGCESVVFAKLLKAMKLENPNPVAIKTMLKIQTPSKLLTDMLEEEKRFNESEFMDPPEEPDAASV